MDLILLDIHIYISICIRILYTHDETPFGWIHFLDPPRALGPKRKRRKVEPGRHLVICGHNGAGKRGARPGSGSGGCSGAFLNMYILM